MQLQFGLLKLKAIYPVKIYVKQKFSSLPFAEVEKVLKKAEAARVHVYKVREVSPVAKIPQKVFDLLQIGLRRNLELATSFVDIFNSELFTPLFVIARAVLEMSVKNQKCTIWREFKIQKCTIPLIINID